MAVSQNIKILVDLIKSVASSPSNSGVETTLETVLTRLLTGSGTSATPTTQGIIDIAHDPTSIELSANKWGVFRNTTTNEVAIWINNNGTIRSTVIVA